jgi:type II secretory pathway predicted ATPase ExeA
MMSKNSTSTNTKTQREVPESEGAQLSVLQSQVQESLEETSPDSNPIEGGGGSIDFDDPFGKHIATEEIYKHAQMEEMRHLVRAATMQRSMMLLIGPPGVGKTTGVRSVTDELPINKYTVVYLGQDQNGGNLMRRFAESLGLPVKGFRPSHVLSISQWLTDNLRNGGKEIILVVDEAHGLDDQTLEELRLLSNADYDRQSPLTLILLAQPWLRARLKAPMFEPLTQRLRYRYSLEGMSEDETRKYIAARLTRAGLDGETFTAEAIHSIFSFSEGIPRRVNNFCSLLLLKAKLAGLKRIDAAMAKSIADTFDS